MKAIVKLQDKSILEQFLILTQNPVLHDVFMVNFTQDPIHRTLIMDYQVVTSISDISEKDYCFTLFQYNREHSYFYLYPQAVNYFIPLLNVRVLFNNLVNFVFSVNVNISDATLDRLFQSFKLSDSDKYIGYLKEAIRSSVYYGQSTNIGRLLYKDFRDDVIKLKDSDCRVFFYKFTQSVINLLEILNLLFSSIEMLNHTDGMVRAVHQIHKAISSVFKTSFWRKLKNIFGSFDMKFLKVNTIFGMFKELGTNLLFNSHILKFLDKYISDTDELDKKYYAVTSGQPISDYIYSDKQKHSDIDVYLKLLNVSDLLTSYESSMFYLPVELLDMPKDLSELLKVFNYKNRQLITLAELNRLKKLTGQQTGTDNEKVDKFLDLSVEELQDILPETQGIVLSRKLVQALTVMLTKYYSPKS